MGTKQFVLFMGGMVLCLYWKFMFIGLSGRYNWYIYFKFTGACKYIVSDNLFDELEIAGNNSWNSKNCQVFKDNKLFTCETEFKSYRETALNFLSTAHYLSYFWFGFAIWSLYDLYIFRSIYIKYRNSDIKVKKLYIYMFNRISLLVNAPFIFLSWSIGGDDCVSAYFPFSCNQFLWSLSLFASIILITLYFPFKNIIFEKMEGQRYTINCFDWDQIYEAKGKYYKIYGFIFRFFLGFSILMQIGILILSYIGLIFVGTDIVLGVIYVLLLDL